MLKMPTIRLYFVMMLITPLFFGGGTWALSVENYLLGGILLSIGVILLIITLRLASYNTRKIAFLFDALENYDFGFRFSTTIGSKDERIMNKSLNRIKDLLQQSILERRVSEQYYELIVQSAASGVIVVDHMGSVYQCNRAALDIFGISVLTHITQLEAVEASIPPTLKAISGGQNATLSFFNERSRVSIALVCNEFSARGKILKIISMNDISSSIEGTEVQSWQRLSRVLTHEIMNSLSPITSLSDALLQCEGSDLRRGLEVIKSTSGSLLKFVENYRTLTRVPTPEKSAFVLMPMLSEVVELFGQDMVTIEQCPLGLELYTDQNLLRGVVINLVRNGLQAGGDVHIKVAVQSNARIAIEIMDTGGGISEEVMQNMFVPFYTTKQGGSGIGLSLSRQVMLALGGSLSLVPHTEHTTFRLTL